MQREMLAARSAPQASSALFAVMSFDYLVGAEAAIHLAAIPRAGLDPSGVMVYRRGHINEQPTGMPF